MDTNWISVSNKLPDTFGDYLVAFDDGVVMSLYYSNIDLYRGYWWYTGIDAAKVTHWMPLPKGPNK